MKKINSFMDFKYTPEEFIKESPVGNTFLVGITFNIEKEGAPFIPG